MAKTLGENLFFTVPLGSDVWPASHHEPLLVDLYFPLSMNCPWRLRGTPFLDLVEGQLSSLPGSDFNWGGIFCANFSAKAGPWSPCHRAWHGDCYCATIMGSFSLPSPRMKQESGFLRTARITNAFLWRGMGTTW
jgi:hypothetical protein